MDLNKDTVKIDFENRIVKIYSYSPFGYNDELINYVNWEIAKHKKDVVFDISSWKIDYVYTPKTEFKLQEFKGLNWFGTPINIHICRFRLVYSFEHKNKKSNKFVIKCNCGKKITYLNGIDTNYKLMSKKDFIWNLKNKTLRLWQQNLNKEI